MKYATEFLTVEKLKNMTPGTIFAKGLAVDEPGELHVARTGIEVPWVAVRGDGYSISFFSKE